MYEAVEDNLYDTTGHKNTAVGDTANTQNTAVGKIYFWSLVWQGFHNYLGGNN